MTLPLRVAQWWRYFKAAGEVHAVDPWLLGAICDRESNGGLTLDPPGPSGTGDNGHGRGLMQIDDRAHPAFVSKMLPSGTMAWEDPAENIHYGAYVLGKAYARFKGWADCPSPEMASIAAYNAGEHAVANAMENLTKPIPEGVLLTALDDITTGKNYVSDILLRRSRFLSDEPSKPPVEEDT